jgi:predicted ester cyclase
VLHSPTDSFKRTAIAAALVGGLTIAGCATTQTGPAPAVGEIGRAIHGADAARHIETFDTLDFDVISNRRWERLGESHAQDVVVTWPDGHDTRGIEVHIRDLEQMFVHAPDAAISTHPIRIALGEWTAVTAIMYGSFTQPMRLPNGAVVQPTGRHFSLAFVTIAHWSHGRIDHEWLYWDTLTYMRQLGLAQ